MTGPCRCPTCGGDVLTTGTLAGRCARCLMNLALSDDNALLGAAFQLGKYEIRGLLGHGGMGEVYLAQDLELDRSVALKILPDELASSPDLLHRFQREARAAASLNHPNICVIYEVAQSDSHHFIAMEYVEGPTLREHIAEKPLPVARVVDLAIQIADALEAAHTAGIVHRDIKSANIILNRRGEPKITDFGLAKRSTVASLRESTLTDVTTPGAVMGTIAYMSPEQALGQEVDHRSDLFSFGVVVYEMLSGHLPFRGRSAQELMVAIVKEPPPPLDRVGVTGGLRRVVSQLLEKDAARRYQSADEVREELVELRPKVGKPEAVAQLPAIPLRMRSIVLLLVAAVLAVAAATFYIRTRAPETAAVTPLPAVELAVTPTRNLAGDPEQDYLAAGITEEIITSLAKLRTLRVIKLAAESPRPVSGLVLDSTFLRSGDEIRVTAQLLDANGEVILAEAYSGSPREASLAIESDIAEAIAQKVLGSINSEQQRRLRNRRPISPAALDAYRRGSYHLNRRNEWDIRSAIDYFRQAIDIDPGYALAYTGLADAYSMLASHPIDGLEPNRAMPLARRAAETAREIDPNLADAHASLALVQLSYDWDLPAAAASFARALELDPLSAKTHHWYGHYFMATGNLERALQEMQTAQRLEPDSAIINVGVGWCYYYAQQYDKAIEQYLRVLEFDPEFGHAHQALAMAYQQKGMYAEAEGEFQTAARLTNDGPAAISSLAALYAVQGKTAEAERELARLEMMSHDRYVPALYFASVHYELGNLVRGFDWLWTAIGERSEYFMYLRVEPRASKLLGNPQFIRLLGAAHP